MANKQTTALRDRGLSLKFKKGVDPTTTRTARDPNPEFELVDMPKQKTGKGNPVNSSRQREVNGHLPYEAQTMRAHPRSGLDNKEMSRLAALA